MTTKNDFYEEDEPIEKLKEAFEEFDGSVTRHMSNVLMKFTPYKRQDINLSGKGDNPFGRERVWTDVPSAMMYSLRDTTIAKSDLDFARGQGSVLLKGIVGSTAYGLDTEDSDIDYAGLYAVDTVQLHGLREPTDSLVYKNPDTTLHEAKKWCQLALKCNPSVLELLWLPDELYTVRTGLGHKLIGIRQSFLSRGYVRNAYLGYATQQLKKIETRGDGSFSAQTRKRTAKHGRHLYRLLMQGYQLYTTGTMDVRLTNVQRSVAFLWGTRVQDGDLRAAKEMIQEYEEMFNEAYEKHCVLPENPETDKVEAWLQNVRREML